MQFSRRFTLLVASAAQFMILAHAANCYIGPKWEYDSTTYSDSWNVRSSLCSQSSSEACRTSGGSIICEFQSNNVYGAFRADSQAEAMTVCWDAFNDIINQCIYSNQPGGFYTYNNMAFTVQPISLGASNN